MTREEIKTYPILVQEADWLRQRVEALRSRIESPRIPALTGQPGARNTTPGSAQERMADDYMDRYPDYARQLEEVTEHMRRIERAVDALPPKERMVCRWHCLERLSYKYIADKLEVSISTVGDIMRSAYAALEAQP